MTEEEVRLDLFSDIKEANATIHSSTNIAQLSSQQKTRKGFNFSTLTKSILACLVVSVVFISGVLFKTYLPKWEWGSKAKENYPLSPPVLTEKGVKYRVGIIADLDTGFNTSSGNWLSHLKRGDLYVRYEKANVANSQVSIDWDDDSIELRSGFNHRGKGMELSELVFFNGKMYTCDDKTGIVYNLISTTESPDFSLVPWVILADGNGTTAAGFKCEWMCVKDGHLVIGSHGNAWTTDTGEVIDFNLQFVKKISPHGEVQHLDWRNNYNKLAEALNIKFPGYINHESADWSDTLQKWIFLPRRVSLEKYSSQTIENKGSNVMLLASEDFDSITVRHVGDVLPTHGFSSFKWIPGTDDNLIVALKSEEFNGKTATYIIVFDTQGNTLLPETKVSDEKFEGFEFI